MPIASPIDSRSINSSDADRVHCRAFIFFCGDAFSFHPSASEQAKAGRLLKESKSEHRLTRKQPQSGIPFESTWKLRRPEAIRSKSRSRKSRQGIFSYSNFFPAPPFPLQIKPGKKRSSPEIRMENRSGTGHGLLPLFIKRGRSSSPKSAFTYWTIRVVKPRQQARRWKLKSGVF